MSTSQWMDWFKKAWGGTGSSGSQSARRGTPANLAVHRLEDRRVLNGVPAGFTGAVTESAGNIVLRAGKADGQADSYQVGVAHSASGDKLEIQVNGEKVFETKVDAFKSLKVVGNEDAESLAVDLSQGTSLLTGIVAFEGGVGHGDRLTLAGGVANSIATEWSDQGGRIAVSGPSQSFTIQFGGSVDRVDDRLAATSRSFSSDVVGQTVSLNTTESPATGRIGLSDGRQFNFQTPSSQLRIDLQGAGDQLHVGNWQSGGNVDLKLDSESLAVQGRVELGTGDLAIHAHRADIAGEIVGSGDSVAIFGGDDSLITVSGRIELTSIGESGSGGRVDLFATRVSIQDGALIDVSGAGSGGTIRIGGDLHGTPGDFTTADRVWIATDANLRADGTGAAGYGGTVVIWSRELTGFSGTISAVGIGGAGGFAEVSSEDTVLYRGSADLRGLQGTMGTLLLDPRTVTIVNQNGGANNNQLNPNVPNPGDPANVILFGDVPTGEFTISETALEAAQSNVLIQATDRIELASLTTDGVLRMRSNVSLTLQTRNDASHGDLATGGIRFLNTANTIRTQGTGKLVLQAGVSATASGVVTGRNGSANITAGFLTSASGAIQLEATGTIAAARSILSTRGALTVAAGGDIQIAAGATLTATNNSIQLTSTHGSIAGAGNVVLTAGNQIQIDSTTTAAGNVSLSANEGVRLGANLTANGTLTVDADKNLNGIGTFQALPGAIVSTTGGAISVASADIDLQGRLSSGVGTTTLTTTALRTIGLGHAVRDWTLDNGEISRITAGELAIGGSTNGEMTLDGVQGAGGSIEHWRLSGPTSTNDSRILFQGIANEFTSLVVDIRKGIVVAADVTTTSGDLELRTFGSLAGTNPIQLEGVRTLKAAGTLSLASSVQRIAASGDLNLYGGDGVFVVSGMDVAGEVFIDSDTDRTGPGTFQIGTGGHTLNSNNHSVTVISADVALDSGINSGTGKTTFLTHSGRTMALGTATGDWSLSPTELNSLVTAELDIGDANNGNIIVGTVSRANSSHIDFVRLTATGDDRRVEFTGGSSTFQSLSVLADAGIGVSSNLSTDTGDLTLNGDSDATPDGNDRITFANEVVVSAGGAMRLRAATGGLLGSGTLQLLANSGVTLDDRLATASDLTINADRRNDGFGPLVAKGRIDVAGQSALLVSSDIDLQGGLTVAGTATLRATNRRSMGIGNAVGDWSFDSNEFRNTTAAQLVFGGGAGGSVTVDGVTATDSAGVASVRVLALQGSTFVTFQGADSFFRELSVEANDGIFLTASVTTTEGPMSFMADTDLDLVGLFSLAAGKTIHSTGHDLSITSADIDLDGFLTAGVGNVFLNPSSPPEVIGIGDTTADFCLSQAELSHIVATSGLVTIGSMANTGGMRIGTTEPIALGDLRTELITGGDATVNGSFSSTTAPLSLTAGNNIRFAPVGSFVSTNGPITLTADALPGNLGGGVFMAAGSKVDGGTGNVTLDADGNVELAKILTTRTASIHSRSGAITHAGPSGEVNITADTAILRAVLGIGETTSPLETEVRLLAAENTTAGRIEIRGVASTPLTLGPTGGLSGVRNLAGDVHVVNRGDLIIRNVESPTLVSLESNSGGIFDGQSGDVADIRATRLALRSSGGIGTAFDALETDVRRVAAENSTAGRIEIRGVSTESLTLGAVDGLSGVSNLAGDTHVVTVGSLFVEYVESSTQVSLQTLEGGIFDGQAGDSPDIVANELVLRSTGGIGLATDALETSVRRLAAENKTTGHIEIRGVSSDSLTLGPAGGLPGVRNLVGDTHVITQGDLIIENVEAPTQVSLQSRAGGIFDGQLGSAADIRANELVLRAAGGIGTSGDALETAVRTIAADNTNTGGIDIHGVSTDSLTLGAAGGLPGVQSHAGDLRVVTEGTLTVESAETFGHEIEFTAVDVDIPGHLSAGAGNVFLNPRHAAELIGIGDTSADFNLSRDDLNHITGTSGLVTIGSLANLGGIHIATSETADIGELRTSLITGADTRVDGRLSSTTAPLLLTAGRNVTFGAAGALVSTQGPISITADALPGSLGSVIQMATGSRIDAGEGDVQLRTDGDITVSSVKTTNSAAIRTDSGAIRRAGPDGMPNVSAGRVALVAQLGIGDPFVPLQVDAGRLAAENFTSGEIDVSGVSTNPLTLGSAGESSGEFPGVRNHAGNVRVVSAGALVIENVESSNQIALQSLAGGIVDGKGGDEVDIRAKSLQMRSSGGIGSTGPNGRLETAVDLVAAANTDGGEIDIFNNTGTGLTVGTVDGLVGLTNTGGGISVDNAKKLSILSQVKTIGGGNISLTSDGDALSGSDLLTKAPILAVGGNGSVFLQAGKNLVLRDSGAEFDIEVENAGQIIGVAQRIVDFGSDVQLKAGPGFVPPGGVVPGLGFVPGLGEGPVFGVVPVLSPSLLYVDAPLVHNSIATVSGQIGDPHGHGYIVVIDWHDGTTTQQYFGDPTSFQFQHFYNSNPDKTDSSKSIPITVTLHDFFQISLTGLHQPDVTTPLSLHETLTVGNGFQAVLTFAEIPGEGLAFPVFVLAVNLPQVTLPAPVTSIILNAFIVPPSMDTRVPPLLTAEQEESRVESREIVLEVLDANGEVSESIPLGEDVLDNLPALFRRLPDGRYRVYLREVGEATRRLLSDVQLRGGRPSDGADAGFDALPTEEEPDFPSDVAPDEGSQPDKESAAVVPSSTLNSEIAPPVLTGAENARGRAVSPRRVVALAAASVIAAGASSRRPWDEEVLAALVSREKESPPVASPWLRKIRRALGQG